MYLTKHSQRTWIQPKPKDCSVFHHVDTFDRWQACLIVLMQVLIGSLFFPCMGFDWFHPSVNLNHCPRFFFHITFLNLKKNPDSSFLSFIRMHYVFCANLTRCLDLWLIVCAFFDILVYCFFIFGSNNRNACLMWPLCFLGGPHKQQK